MLEGDFCCSAQCSGSFMSDKCEFFVAGAIIFGEVGGCLLLLRAL